MCITCIDSPSEGALEDLESHSPKQEILQWLITVSQAHSQPGGKLPIEAVGAEAGLLACAQMAFTDTASHVRPCDLDCSL